MSEYSTIFNTRIYCGRIDIGKNLNPKSLARKKAFQFLERL